MFRRTSTRILSVLLTLMLLLGCLPGNPAAAALETEHAHEFLLAEAQAHDHEHDHDHGTDGCACFDCACADCACEDCGDCGDCRCEDCACEDCGDCACGHAHAHGCACGDAEPDDVPERALDQGPGITDRYGVPIRQKLAEREERKSAHLEALRAKDPAAVHPVIAGKLAAGETGGMLTEAEFSGAGNGWAEEDAVECDYCGKRIWGDWICDDGPHCGKNSGNEDCYKGEHCADCESCQYTVCEDCFFCEVCWFHCLVCEDCFVEADVCDTCRCCESCQETNTHCQDCGSCLLDAPDDSTTNRWLDCAQKGHRHCMNCAEDYFCNKCEHCYYEDTSDFCPACQRCVNCIDEKHCRACKDIDKCMELGEVCDSCGLCDDCKFYYEDGDNVYAAHCWECEACAYIVGGSDFWCPALQAGETDMAHCRSCCENCPKCGKCLLAENVDICLACGLCPECCEENSEAAGCSHGYCVESIDYENHLCPGCEKCDGGPICDYCGLCALCAEDLHCDEHNWCPEDAGYDDHFCSDCGKCFWPSDFCEDCGFCEECQKEYHCSDHDMCPFSADAWEHFCDECGECMEDLCDVCGGHLIHCQEIRDEYGCEHDDICPNDSDWDAHFCDDCGLCYELSEFCDDCGRCQDCCMARREDLCTCGFDPPCIESSEWEDHYCFEHDQCLETCIDDGTHQEGCDHDPDGDYCWDADSHWQHCTECEGRVSIEAHTLEAVWIREPSYQDKGLQRLTCAVCGAELGVNEVSRKSIGDHTHVFGGDARCTVCGLLDVNRPRIVSEPRDTGCTVSDIHGDADWAQNRVTFMVFAKGDALSYQWYVSKNGGAATALADDGELVFGAETANLTVVVPADACYTKYSYSCTVSNSFGPVTSRKAALRAKHNYTWEGTGDPIRLTVNGRQYVTFPTHAEICLGDGCETVKMDKEHAWSGSWTVDFIATAEAEGLKSRTCLTCGWKEYKVIPKVEETHIHRYTDVQSDEVSHWYECACGKRDHKSVHYYNPDNWVVSVPATETTPGTEVNPCIVCRREKSRETPLVPHTHSYYTWEEITDGFAAGTWQKMIQADETCHYVKCHYSERCGGKLKEPHSWADGYTLVNVSGGTATYTHTCLICGYSQSFTMPAGNWQLIGKGVQIVDVDRVPVSSTAGNEYLGFLPAGKTGYLPTGVRILKGGEWCRATPENDDWFAPNGAAYFISPYLPAAQPGDALEDHIIVVEAEYAPCPHELTGGDVDSEIAPGCVTYGKNADIVCRRCGQVLREGTPIDPIGHHNYVLDESTAVTGYCTAVPAGKTGVVGRGYEGDWVCTVCGDRYKGKKTAPVHYRDYLDGVVEETCDKGGFDGNLVCQDCGKIIERGHSTPRLKHKWSFAEDYIVAPTTKTTGKCLAICEYCGAERVCTMNESAAGIARMGFTEEEWKARLDYTGEDWEVRLRVSANQTTRGAFDHPGGSEIDYLVDLGTRDWSDRLLRPENDPVYTFTFESTGRNPVTRIKDVYASTDSGCIPCLWELGEDGMSVKVTVPFSSMGAGEYILSISPLFETLWEDGSTNTSGMYLEEIGTFGQAGAVAAIVVKASVIPGAMAHSITVLDRDESAPAPLPAGVCSVTDAVGRPITEAKPGQKVTVRFQEYDHPTPPQKQWADLSYWEYVSGRPEGAEDKMYDLLQDFIMPDSDVTLRAVYRGSGLPFTVTFDLGGKAENFTLTRNGADYVGAVEDPECDDGPVVWNFMGWYREDSFKNPVDLLAERVHGDVTFYARWSLTRGTVIQPRSVSGLVTSQSSTAPAVLLYPADVSGETILAEYRAMNTASRITDYTAAVSRVSSASGRYTFSFSFGNVPHGDYKLVIMYTKVVPYIIPFKVRSKNVDLGTVALTPFGDVNLDGTVSSDDVLQISRYINGLSSTFSLSEGAELARKLYAADMDGDGSVRAADALQLLRAINRLSSVFDDLP